MKSILTKCLVVLLALQMLNPLMALAPLQPEVAHAEGAGAALSWTEIETVSASVYGNWANGPIFASEITPDGRYVVFATSATNLDDRASSGDTHIYVRDRLTDQVALLDANADGEVANASAQHPSISNDGRYVVFQSGSTNLVAATNGIDADSPDNYGRIYVADRATGAIALVSLDSTSVAADGASENPEISGNGQFVVFQSVATNLTGTPGVSGVQVYVRDLTNQTTELVSQAFAANGNASEPSISDDGQVVACLISQWDGTDWAYHVYRFDLIANSSTMATARTDGSYAGEHHHPVVSADGSRIAFASSASNLVPGDNNGKQDIFLYDHDDGGTLSRISVDDAGNQSDADSFSPDINPDGTRIAFESEAQLIEGMQYDTEGSTKTIYIYDTAADQLANVGGIEHAYAGAQPSLANDALAYVDGTVANVAMNAADMPAWPDHSLLSLVEMDNIDLKLSWDPIGDPDLQLYKLYKTAYEEGTGWKTAFIETIPANVTTITVPSPTPGEMNHEVTYRIEAVNSLYHTSQSGPTMMLGIDTDDTESPAWPEGSVIRIEQTKSDSVTLSWPAAADNTGVDTYWIYMDVPVTEEQDFTPVFNTSDTSYAIPGLAPDTAYSFYVTAMDAASNESVPLPIVEVTTLPESELVVEGVLTAEEPQADGSVPLIWSADERISSYEIWDVTDASQPVKLADAGNEDRYTLMGLEASSTYQLQVIGFIGASGGNANYASNTVQVNTPPIAIDRVTLSRNHILGGVAALGSAETVTVTGQPARTAHVKATYLTWYDTDGTTVLDTPRETSQEVSMAEDSGRPGTYTGTFTFTEGVTRLVKLEAYLTDTAEHETTTVTAADLPVDVAAGLKVNVAAIGNSANYRINVYSPSLLASQSNKVGDGGEVIFDRLPVASDYRIRVLSPIGELVQEITGVELKSGLYAEQAISLEIPKKLVITVSTGEEVLRYQKIAIYDEQGTVLQTSSTGAGGTTPTIEINAQTEAVVAKLSDIPVEYTNPGEISIELNEDTTHQTVLVEKRGTGTIQGTVALPGGAPMAGAFVQILQTVNGSPYSANATTDANGQYQLTAYEGEAEVVFSAPLIKGMTGESETVAVNAGVAQTVNHRFSAQQLSAVTINLYTKYAGDEQWQGPLPIDWTTGIHLQIKIDGKNVIDPTTILNQSAGDKVIVSANGEEGGLGKDAKTVVLEEDGDTEVDLYLEQSDARTIQAELQSPSDWQGYQPSWTASLFKWNGSYWAFTDSYSGSGDRVQFATEESGRMKLTVSGSSGYVETEFDKQPSRDLNLHVLQLQAREGAFGDAGGNGLTAAPVELTPDGSTTVHARYQSKIAAEQASIILEIPDGMTFVEQSLSLNGAAVPYSIQGSSVVVDLGTLPPAASGEVTYRLTAQQAAASELWVNAQIAYETDGQPKYETIGTVRLRHEPITIEAPSLTNSLEWALHGKAPAGQMVTVYADTQPLGRTLAMPGGLWNMNITLPDPQGAQVFRLHAAYEYDGTTIRSPETEVRYEDPEAPVIEQITMQQTGGRRISLDVSKGTARFPYVVVPGQSYKFEVVFNHPDRVENVQVHLKKSDDTVVSSQAELKDGIYYAMIPSMLDTILSEAVYVTFDRKPAPPPQIETTDDLIRELPPGMRDYQVVDKQELQLVDANTLAGSLDYTLPQANDLQVHVDMTIEQHTGYVPTEADLKLAAELGVEAYGVHVDTAEEDGQYVTTIAAYVPEDSLGEDVNQLFAGLSYAIGGEGKRTRVLAPIGGTYEALKKIAVKVFLDEHSISGQIGKGSLGIADTTSSLNGKGDIADKMNQLGYLAVRIGTCNPAMAAIYGPKIEKLATHALSLEGSKWGMMLGGVLMAPATFGGSIAMTIGTMAVGKMMDANVEAQIKKLQNDVAYYSRAKTSKCLPQRSKQLGDPLVNPVWIYDPSGFVYETFPDNPIEDVQATVFYRDGASSQYVPWQADWYGQTNPQMTDAAGKYGWDVPSGHWQVVYEKDGYEVAKSEEMDVPPPHFDVNVPMVSYVPPQVTAAKAQSAADGLTIDFTTDKYMAAARLTDDAIVVSSGGTPLAGTLAAVNARVDDSGHALTRTFRFSSDQTVPAGGVLSVTLRGGAVVSYAGVEMEQDYTRSDLQVLSKDTAAPTITNATTNASGNIITIVFDEPLDTTRPLAAGKFALSGAPWPVVGAGYGRDGTTVEVSLAGNVRGADALSIHIAGDVLADLNGNRLAAQDIAIRNQAMSVDASLSDLRIAGYSLSPRFQSSVEAYTVTIPNGVDSLPITAISSSDKAVIRVNGVIVPSGTAYEAVIENETLIISATAEDGLTQSFYEIDIKRGQPSSGSSAPVYPSATGHSSTAGDLYLSAGEAGTVSLGDRVLVTLPQGAFPQAVRIRIAEVDDAPDDGANQHLVLLSPVYEITKDAEGKFDNPVTITIQWTADKQPDSSIAIYYYDETGRRWIKIGGTVNGNTITAAVDHFTKFAVFASEETAVPEMDFTDIQGHWAATFIAEAVQRGMASGYPDHTFQPDRTVTRAEFTALLARALSLEPTDDPLAFADVSAIPGWAAADIARAVAAGIVQGYEDRTFRPNRTITREEMMVMLVKALQLNVDMAKTSTFADNALISSWAKPYVAAADEADLIAGTGNHHFSPSAPATRAEAITFLLRAADLEEQSK